MRFFSNDIKAKVNEFNKQMSSSLVPDVNEEVGSDIRFEYVMESGRGGCLRGQCGSLET